VDLGMLIGLNGFVILITAFGDEDHSNQSAFLNGNSKLTQSNFFEKCAILNYVFFYTQKTCKFTLFSKFSTSTKHINTSLYYFVTQKNKNSTKANFFSKSSNHKK
jgi:hypothetical protein